MEANPAAAANNPSNDPPPISIPTELQLDPNAAHHANMQQMQGQAPVQMQQVAGGGNPPQQLQMQQQQQLPQQAAQQQQQSSQEARPLNGGWQSDQDVNARRKMIAKIVALLQQRKPHAPEEWLKKLPQMAKRLEESLYRSAANFEAYNDVQTLKQRLQALAMSIGHKTQQAKLRQQQEQAARNGGAPQLGGVDAQANSSGLPQVVPSTLGHQSSLAGGPAAVQGSAPGPGAAGQSRNADRQQVLRHQQQRLLLLRHAAKCPHENGKCPVTPHCAGMKRLWKHIAECKDQKCLVPHCVSSRYVLSHYHRCKDSRCPVCMPVREAIHRSHEKAKQMNMLKQRHEQALAQQQGRHGYGQQGYQMSGADSSKRRKNNGAKGKVDPRQVQMQRQQMHPQYARQMQMQGRGGYPGGFHPQMHRPPQVLMPLVSAGKAQVEDQTLVNSFTIPEIERHIESLNQSNVMSPSVLKAKCLEILKEVMQHQFGWVFNAPVDPVELGLPDYFEVIKKPMDLGTVKKNVETLVYHDIESFKENCHLAFDNALNYNANGSSVYNMAAEIKKHFNREYDKVLRDLNAEHAKRCNNGEACALCGMEKKLFEPAVFYCNGTNCPSKRIRRNSYYYVAGNNQYHWCHQCFTELKEANPVELPDMVVRKSDLAKNKRKNDDQPEESWVACDTCGRWIHQICGLFNTRQNKDQRSKYECPHCTIKSRKASGKLGATSTAKNASDLPRTKLSEYMERHINELKIEKYKELAKEKAETEGIELEEAMNFFTNNGEITIRQVTSMDRNIAVRDGMKRRYKFKNYPEEFKFRCKCLVVFQRIDGVDVMLFGLYVYEHDKSNPKPNHRAIYVSYLDSVHYMQPRKIRTFIYHEILIAYLDYVRHRGFATAHIWACPPLKGDDYILYAKPEDQRTPKDAQLRQWYIDMLATCEKRDIVKSVTNMHDLYFANPANDATIVPYLDGDYWVGEAENIIKELEEGSGGKKKGNSGSKKKQKKAAGNNARGGTRSTGLDEEALIASGIVEPPPKSLEDGGRDILMQKLGEAILPMKESFLVAFLNWEEKTAIRDKEIEKEKAIEAKEAAARKVIEDAKKAKEEEEKKKEEEEKKKKEEEEAKVKKEKEEGEGETKEGEEGEQKGEAMDVEEKKVKKEEEATAMEVEKEEKEKEKEEKKPSPAKGKARSAKKKTKKQLEEEEKAEKEKAEKEKGKEEEEEVKSEAKKEKEEEAKPAASIGGKKRSRDGEEVKMEEKKEVKEEKEEAKDVKEEEKEEEEKEEKKEEEVKEEPWTPEIKAAEEKAEKEEREKRLAAGETTIAVLPKKVRDRFGKWVNVMDDDAETMDCEHLNSRQQFLNLCQVNHYQNNTLRNAKHTSMMVLWHLHNREAPKFVQQCSVCSREILLGYRYHCQVCTDFDVCQDCMHGPLKANPHWHTLQPIRIKEEEQSEKQKKERQRSIQLHMQLLAHAAACDNEKCPSANCSKMKGLLKHGRSCQIQAKGGCHVCKRIWALLQLHARQCKARNCSVPSCDAIRESARRLLQQQQQMDDRRREMMNKAMRGARG
ncbi:hypothetical protein TrST_g12427 [Triparma strigata]|uniref:histone acetyltransferase n=1 Tax=Triparma strigata TaxID=1606541 RepID=A0A9W7E9B4_9STRA|nr:hypothetical protein TrST_g12427 [Triparma strigata]